MVWASAARPGKDAASDSEQTRGAESEGFIEVPLKESDALSLEPERQGADDNAQRHQHQAERKSKGEVALTGFRGDGRRHGSRVARDIAADDEDCPNLGNRAAEA